MKKEIENFMEFIRHLKFSPTMLEGYSGYDEACERLRWCDAYLNDRISFDKLVEELNTGCPYDDFTYYTRECDDKNGDDCNKCWRNMLLGEIKSKEVK